MLIIAPMYTYIYYFPMKSILENKRAGESVVWKCENGKSFFVS